MTHKFGIEIEYVGMGHDARRAANIISTVSGVSILNRGWNVKNDGSVSDRVVRCTNRTRDGYTCGGCEGCRNTGGVELVSPPMLFNEASFMEVMQVSEAIMASGGEANETCGLHVHVDARFITRNNWSPAHKQGFFQHIIDEYAKDEEIFDSFMIAGRTGDSNGYCHTMKTVRYSEGMNRYHKLNTVSFPRHGTVEFRHHHGTVDHKEIIPWVKQCVLFMQKSRYLYESYHGLITKQSIQNEMQELIGA